MTKLFSTEGNTLSTRTSGSVADMIRREILSGNLKPDQPLLERDIAQELGVSRTPVREALFVLQGEGLVELTPRKYARVRRITNSDITHIYSLRRVLEAHSAESAACYANSAAIVEIETALIRQKNLGRNCTGIEQANADFAFHAAIAAASGSQILSTVMHQVLAFTATLRSRFVYDAAHSRSVIAQHRSILAAIKTKNPEKAAMLMSEHVTTSMNYAKEQAFTFET